MFDVEAVNWTIPIAVGFFDGYNYHEFIKKQENDDVIWEFLSLLKERFRGIKLYAHCASKFDNKFILASLCKHGQTVGLELGLVKLRWKEPNITFEDSYLLVPMSLARMNKMFGVEEKGTWEHDKGLRPWEMGDSFPTFREYLKNDCTSLSHSLHKLCELLGYTFGIMPSISLSTTSVKAFDKCFYDLDEIYPNEEYEEFIREATYGGRNEVYKRYGEDINLYDVHWMYTSCYDTPVPTGRMRWVKPNLDIGTLAEATVRVPKDWYIGPLPYRLDRRLIFPVGEFTSWWDVNELRSAAEMGVDITIRRQLYCEEEPILKDFGVFMSRLRGGKKDNFWKIFGLALSGKFGQSRWRDSIKHISEISDMKGYTPLDDEELYFTTKEYLDRKAPYIRPAVSMRVRSEARIRHLKLILQALKFGEVFYSDTDSIFTTTQLPTSGEVGGLTFLGKADKGYFIRQKLYATIVKGKMRQKSAGYSDLKLSEEDFISLLNGTDLEVGADVLSSYRTILKQKELSLLDRGRLIKGSLGDNRIPVGNDTKPICLP